MDTQIYLQSILSCSLQYSLILNLDLDCIFSEADQYKRFFYASFLHAYQSICMINFLFIGKLLPDL